MGTRMRGTFRTYRDIGVGIDIIDVNGGGEIEVDIVDFRIYNEGEVDDPHTLINGCRIAVTIKIRDEVDKSIVDDIGTMVTDRFYVTVRSLADLIFVGIVQHDGAQYPDWPYPFEFTISAIDPITRLWDIDYLDVNGDPYVEKTSLIDILFQQLIAKLNLNSIYAQAVPISDPFLMLCNWYDANMKNFTDNPWIMTRCDPQVFYKTDNEGEVIAPSCGYVFEELIKPFGLRYKFAAGRMLLEQLSERTKLSNEYYVYDISGGGGSKVSKNWIASLTKGECQPSDQTKLNPISTGYFRWLNPLRRVKVRYTYDASVAVTKFEANFEGTLVGHSNKVCTNFYPDQGGSYSQVQFSNTDDQTRIRLTGELSYTSKSPDGTFSTYKPHRIVFIIAVKVFIFESNSAYVWHRVVAQNFANPQPAVPPAWVADGNTPLVPAPDGIGYQIVTDVVPFGGDPPAPKHMEIGIETLTIPDSPGAFGVISIGVCVYPHAIYDENGMDASDQIISWAFSNMKITVGQDDSQVKPETKVLEVTSTIAEGGKGEKTIETILGDKGRLHGLEVDNGSEWVATAENWGVGGSGVFSLTQLLADEIHKIRRKPVRIMQRTIEGASERINASRSINYDGEIFIGADAQHNVHPDEITGTWFAIAEGFAVVNTRVLNWVDKVFNIDTNRENIGDDVDIEGIAKLTTNLLSGTAITQLPIQTADHQYFNAGEIIELRDPITGAKQKFTVNQDTKKGDTIVHVDSVTLTENFTSLGYIIQDWDFEAAQTHTEFRLRYMRASHGAGFTAPTTEIVFDDGDLPDPAAVSTKIIAKRVTVVRGTNKQIYAATPLYNYEYGIDFAANKIKFSANFPLNQYDVVEIFVQQIQL